MVSVSRATRGQATTQAGTKLGRAGFWRRGGWCCGAGGRRDGRNHHDARSVAARWLPPAKACAGIGIALGIGFAAVPHA